MFICDIISQVLHFHIKCCILLHLPYTYGNMRQYGISNIIIFAVVFFTFCARHYSEAIWKAICQFWVQLIWAPKLKVCKHQCGGKKVLCKM